VLRHTNGGDAWLGDQPCAAKEKVMTELLETADWEGNTYSGGWRAAAGG
jgi:hypothetical protein